MNRFGRSVVLVALAAMLAVSLGCSKKEEPTLEAKVSPPAVKTAGVLVAGVDLSMPPFAGTDNGKQAGIDIDVASALAEQLGLTVKFVDVKPSEAATALADGTADIVLSVPLDSDDLSQMSLAGSYISDAPAFFVSTGDTSSVDASLTLTTVSAPKIGAQTESASYWTIRHELGEDVAEGYPTLREALQALSNGTVTVVAGDALVGAYIARDFPTVHFAGQMSSGTPLAVAVAADNTTLGDAVREQLDGLAANGVLDTIRRKWVGDIPEIEVPTESSEETTTP